jgi:FkbM family methyltransferase
MSIRQDGYRLHFFPTAFSASLWADMPDTSDDERFLRTFLRPGQVVVDVGANIGTHAIVSALQVGPAGRVFACEAHPATAGYLRSNIRLNGLEPVIEVIESAAGEARSEAVFSDERSDDQNHVVMVRTEGIRVPVETLDSLIPKQPVDLLKIDVEGFELMVLRGSCDTLSRTRAIYFEAWDQHFARYAYCFADLFDFLLLHEFTIMNPQTQKPIARTERMARCVNLLALRREATS